MKAEGIMTMQIKQVLILVLASFLTFQSLGQASIKDYLAYLNAKAEQAQSHITNAEPHVTASDKAKINNASYSGIGAFFTTNLTANSVGISNTLTVANDITMNNINMVMSSNGVMSVAMPILSTVPNWATYTNQLYTNWVIELPIQEPVNGTNIGPISFIFPSAPYPFWSDPALSGTYVSQSVSNRPDLKAILGYWYSAGQHRMVFGFTDAGENNFFISWSNATSSSNDLATTKYKALISGTDLTTAYARYGTNVSPTVVTVTNGTISVVLPVYTALATTSQLHQAVARNTNSVLINASLDATNLMVRGSATVSNNLSIIGQSFLNGNVGIGTNYSASKLRVEGTAVASNFSFITPRWVDEKVSGLTLNPNPSSAPSLQPVVPGSIIQGLAWSIGDKAYFSIQVQHGVADTNAVFPNFYYQPHLHVSCSELAANSNATFAIHWQVATINSTYDSLYHRTNTVTFATTNFHQILDFGYVTNNDLQGRDSFIFRGMIERIAGTADVAADTAFTDSIDMHIPISEMGSRNSGGDSNGN